MPFDVARVRGLTPAIGDGWVHLDAPGGTQCPEQVALTMGTAVRAPISPPGAAFPASQRAEVIEDAARQAVADLVGGDPRGVVLGPGREVMIGRLAEAVADRWQLGDQIVLSRLDDVANIAPWRRVAEQRGVGVRWAEIEIETCELPEWQYDELLRGPARVVAVTAGSEHVGTRPRIDRIAERARRAGALMVVDGFAAAACGRVRMDDLGADVLVLSSASWGGPQTGVLVFRDPTLLDRLPSCSLDPLAIGPGRLEVGPHSYPLLAGLVASIDYLSTLDDAAQGERPQRLDTSMRSVGEYQSELLGRLIYELRFVPRIQIVGTPDENGIPAIAFTHETRKAQDVATHLADRGVCAVADLGDHGVLEHLGTGEVGGVVKVGLAHYSTTSEIDQLARALTDLI
ncbi:aminotransferase class V-fold PLP-dependent enzyme [Pseudonocardia spinosispora]|uniref:aminotransferase class V-fold PLP-dependent enzyme n=1 Tax=Pseudonocardia spinosispora TaxID=103441 RepID=UPI00048BB467|nr:aminotransferase class V-fold PLP-dependent enzyme [Pseudonocardia spinosispora]